MLVSIVVDNFNYGAYLERSVASALAQTHPRVEVIVVDDASTDGSREVLEAFRNRFTPVLRDRNGGQAAAFNEGFRSARGEVVVFLDADDYLHPDAAAAIVSAWRPGLSRLQYRLDLVDAAGRVMGRMPAPEIGFDTGDLAPLVLADGACQANVTSGNAFSRRALEAVLPIPEEDFRAAADGYLVVSTAFAGPVASLERVLGAYRIHGANAWAHGATGLRGSLERELAHRAHCHAAIRREAARRGLVAAADMEDRDPHFLTAAIGVAVLGGAPSARAGSRRAALGLWGARASWRARGHRPHRAAGALWFLAAGLLPRRLASPLVQWRLAPASRPAALARLLHRVRRALEGGPSERRQGPVGSSPTAPRTSRRSS